MKASNTGSMELKEALWNTSMLKNLETLNDINDGLNIHSTTEHDFDVHY